MGKIWVGMVFWVGRFLVFTECQKKNKAEMWTKNVKWVQSWGFPGLSTKFRGSNLYFISIMESVGKDVDKCSGKSQRMRNGVETSARETYLWTFLW